MFLCRLQFILYSSDLMTYRMDLMTVYASVVNHDAV